MTDVPKRSSTLRGARNLSLGSGRLITGASSSRANTSQGAKKVFTPNVNVTRKKNQFPEDSECHADKSVQRGRGPRNQTQRGRRNTHNANLVQASGGVFAEGVAMSAQRTSSRSHTSSASGYIEPPVLKLKTEVKIDKEAEEAQIRRILKDDLLDDEDFAPDSSYGPVRLPLLETKIKCEVKKEVPEPHLHESAVRKEPEPLPDGIRIKQEVMDDVEAGQGEAAASSCEMAAAVKKEPHDDKDALRKADGLNLCDLLNCKDNGIFLVQLPDRLPCFSRGESEEQQPKRPSKEKQQTSTKPEEPKEEEQPFMCLEDLEAGNIGTLQVRKSGKIELVFGSCIVNVCQGTDVGFRQDLVAALLDPASESGDVVDLGPVVGRLVCTPDWDSLLKHEHL